MGFISDRSSPADWPLDRFEPRDQQRIRECWHLWQVLDSGKRSPRDRREERLVRIMKAARNAVVESEEEALLRSVVQCLARSDHEDLLSETPHYPLCEPAEEWYPRVKCKIGIHIPNPRRRVYFEKRKHR